jgi:hypothetical protein
LVNVFSCWDSFEDVYKPCANINVVRLAAAEERIDNGCSDRCIVVSAEEVVLASNR